MTDPDGPEPADDAASASGASAIRHFSLKLTRGVDTLAPDPGNCIEVGNDIGILGGTWSANWTTTTPLTSTLILRARAGDADRNATETTGTSPVVHSFGPLGNGTSTYLFSILAETVNAYRVQSVEGRLEFDYVGPSPTVNTNIACN